MQYQDFEIDMPSDVIGQDWLVGEPTRLLDRFTPLVEEARLPIFESADGKLGLRLDAEVSIREQGAASGWKAKLRNSLSGKPAPKNAPDSLVCLDLRLRYPGNWAHAFTNHLPLALLIASEIKLPPDQICVVLPQSISRKIVSLFEKASFSVFLEDGPVSGRYCHFELEPWISLRGCRCAVLKETLVGSRLKAEVLAKIGPEKKIFVSRRDQRKLVNEAEIESCLAERGYQKIYPEDYGLVEQIALICGAESIVAVHGAGLGPLILKSILDEQPYQLLEIFSPAHITNVYRMIAHQTGGSWIGVRGNLWPELLGGEENFVGNMKDFSVSMDALKKAFEIQNGQEHWQLAR